MEPETTFYDALAPYYPLLYAEPRAPLAGGLLVLSVRDHAVVPRRTPDLRPQAVHRLHDRLVIVVQVWEWDGDRYDLRLYLTEKGPDGACRTQVLRSRYYAVTIDRLLALMAEAGFTNVERVDDAFFQPLVIGLRAASRC